MFQEQGQRVLHLAATWLRPRVIRIAPRPLLQQSASSKPTEIMWRDDCFLLRAKPGLSMWQMTFAKRNTAGRMSLAVCRSYEAWIGHRLIYPPSLARCEPKQVRRRAWPKDIPHVGCYRGVTRTHAGNEVVWSMDLLNGPSFERSFESFLRLNYCIP